METKSLEERLYFTVIEVCIASPDEPRLCLVVPQKEYIEERFVEARNCVGHKLVRFIENDEEREQQGRCQEALHVNRAPRNRLCERARLRGVLTNATKER